MLIYTKMKTNLEAKIIYPESVQIELKGGKILVSGPLGRVEKEFFGPTINIKKEDGSVVLSCKNASKHDKMILNTIKSLLKNMINGVKSGFQAKLKICSGHFPMNVSVSGNELLIKNFMGEKVARKAVVLPNVKVKVEGDIIIVSDFEKETVGQTYANIEKATYVVNKDRRVFQDGIYLIK